MLENYFHDGKCGQVALGADLTCITFLSTMRGRGYQER